MDPFLSAIRFGVQVAHVGATGIDAQPSHVSWRARARCADLAGGERQVIERPGVIAMDVEDDDYNGYSWVDQSGFYLPGTPAPMCYCGDPCKMRVSGLYKTYWQRYWCCANEDGDRSVDAPGYTSPPICDFKEWIDTERSKLAMEVVERNVTAKRIRRENAARAIAKRERKEAEEHERAEVRKKEAEQREKERERKRERARRAKQALEEGGSQAVRKGKWPRLTGSSQCLCTTHHRSMVVVVVVVEPVVVG
ncbi:hypothetical protein EJB05_13750, partial [Eragrostis curvula]